MKLGLLTACLVLVAGGAVGCGDDDGSGADKGGGGGDEAASTEDFCAAFKDFADELQGMTGEEENLGEILKEAAQKIEDAGTPEGIPDDAKEGLQLTLDALQDLPDDASAEDMVGLQDEFSDTDKAKTSAFNEYLAETCPELGDSGGDGSSDSGSGSDSGSVSGGPSDDSSDGS